jgi:hypothetical protein
MSYVTETAMAGIQTDLAYLEWFEAAHPNGFTTRYGMVSEEKER